MLGNHLLKKAITTAKDFVKTQCGGQLKGGVPNTESLQKQGKAERMGPYW